MNQVPIPGWAVIIFTIANPTTEVRAHWDAAAERYDTGDALVRACNVSHWQYVRAESEGCTSDAGDDKMVSASESGA